MSEYKRVCAPCWPRVFGKLQDQWLEVPKIEQRTFEQLEEVDVLAYGEVNLVPQERMRQLVGKLRDQLVKVLKFKQRTC